MDSLETLEENFTLFDDWEDRYAYLIELGRRLPPMDDALKTEENFVHGCTSRVWMASGIENGRYRFVADSDAMMVRGLIAILMSAYQNKPVEEIGAVDIEAAFTRMGLESHLSPNRRSGFFAMVERIRQARDVGLCQ